MWVWCNSGPVIDRTHLERQAEFNVHRSLLISILDKKKLGKSQIHGGVPRIPATHFIQARNCGCSWQAWFHPSATHWGGRGRWCNDSSFLLSSLGAAVEEGVND